MCTRRVAPRKIDLGDDPKGPSHAEEGIFKVERDVLTRYTREPWAAGARKEAVRKARDPDRRAKLAAAKRGNKRPPHVVDAVRRAHLGWTHPPEARAKLSAAMREGAKTFVPNGRRREPCEDELVRTRPAAEVARRTGRSLTSVYSRRRVPKVRDGRQTSAGPPA